MRMLGVSLGSMLLVQKSTVSPLPHGTRRLPQWANCQGGLFHLAWSVCRSLQTNATKSWTQDWLGVPELHYPQYRWDSSQSSKGAQLMDQINRGGHEKPSQYWEHAMSCIDIDVIQQRWSNCYNICLQLRAESARVTITRRTEQEIFDKPCNFDLCPLVVDVGTLFRPRALLRCSHPSALSWAQRKNLTESSIVRLHRLQSCVWHLGRNPQTYAQAKGFRACRPPTYHQVTNVSKVTV